MSILLDRNSRVLVQGITGREGKFHSGQMIEYGTSVVGGVTPGKGGEWVHGKPVFDTVRACVEATGANCSMILVPAPFAGDAIFEAIDSGNGFDNWSTVGASANIIEASMHALLDSIEFGLVLAHQASQDSVYPPSSLSLDSTGKSHPSQANASQAADSQASVEPPDKTNPSHADRRPGSLEAS